MPVELPKQWSFCRPSLFFLRPHEKQKPEVCHETELWRDLDLVAKLKKINFL